MLQKTCLLKNSVKKRAKNKNLKNFPIAIHENIFHYDTKREMKKIINNKECTMLKVAEIQQMAHIQSCRDTAI